MTSLVAVFLAYLFGRMFQAMARRRFEGGYLHSLKFNAEEIIRLYFTGNRRPEPKHSEIHDGCLQ